MKATQPNTCGDKFGTFDDIIASFRTWKGVWNVRELEIIQLIKYAANASASP